MKQLKWLLPCLALWMMITAPARADVLQHVHADALLVVKVNNLKSVSDKAGMLAERFGLAAMDARFSNPLRAIRDNLGLREGLDEAGEAAFVLADIIDDVPAVYFLVPVTDYKAFLNNFPGAVPADGDMTSIRFPDGEQGFAVQWGPYAAIAPGEEVLTRRPQGIKADGLAARELSEKDAVVYANFAALREKVLPMLREAREDMLDELEDQLDFAMDIPENFKPIIQIAAERAFDVVEQFFEQGDAATLGIFLDRDGINTTLAMQFNADSDYGQTVARIQNTRDSLLEGLPRLKYLMVGGMAIDPNVTIDVVNRFVAPIEAELAELGEEAKPIQEYLNSLRDSLKAQRATAYGWVAPAGLLGQESIFQFVSIVHGDAPTVIQTQRDMFQTQQAFMGMFDETQAMLTTSYTENAKTIDGVALNHFQASMKMEGRTPEQQQVAQMMEMMYGPGGGIGGYTGAIDDNKVISGIGVEDDVLAQLIASARDNDPTMGELPGIKMVAARLPQERLAVMFIPVDQIATTAVAYAAMFFGPVNLRLPDDLPPVGVTVATEGPAVRIDSVIPADLVQNIVAGFMQMFMGLGQQRPGGAL